MRVAIDLIIAEKEPGGMLFATRALLEGLARTDQTNEYIVITTRPKEYRELANAPSITIYPVKLRTWRGILIQHQLTLPDILKKLKPDVLHVPAFAAPIGWHGPLVITVHDLAFLKVPQQSSLYARLYWQYLLRESVRRAQCVISISEQTSEELRTLWGIEDERIHLIHNAIRPLLRLDTVANEAQVGMHQRYGKRYILHVGRIMPRKNVETLIAAFNAIADCLPDLNLVLAGGAGYDSAEVIQQAKKSPFHERIHLAGWIPDEDMSALYAAAEVLVVPSKHEGFGLPALEAMVCETPVIASPGAASMEIAGGAVMRVDCEDASKLSEAIVAVVTNQALREQLVGHGKTQVEPFTCESCARATRRIYELAAGLPSTNGMNQEPVVARSRSIFSRAR
ncbi:glycosyltransferase family 4 protein [Ktedonobacter racemifer]|uniref:Glycosyl transferase group 1 n=1 Tax=Ktedonobacter racemifer DSM 44963 TaxID=485913 RepID=D6TQ93_KTERA|nr:glycosyltransferase family 1 protein [Ktedonobacter racemifer]EFH85741.1 glycosyl transferase group 1 [Ktedonobacter racemifer DSM 44963]